MTETTSHRPATANPAVRLRRGPGHRWLPLTFVAAGLLLLATLVVLRFRPVGVGETAVRGLITAVTARDIGHAESIALRDREGQEHRFLVAEEIDPHWTPGHLREHMTFGDLVTVYYRREGAALVAVRITD